MKTGDKILLATTIAAAALLVAFAASYMLASPTGARKPAALTGSTATGVDSAGKTGRTFTAGASNTGSAAKTTGTDDPARNIPKPDEVEQDPDLGSISGRVLDETGGPVQDAVIGVRFPTNIKNKTVSLENGKYILKNLPPNRYYHIECTKPSYCNYERRALVVEAGRDTPRIDMIMYRAGSLHITVVDESGKGVPGAILSASAKGLKNGAAGPRGGVRKYAYGHTAGGGKLRFEGLFPGKWTIRTMHRTFVKKHFSRTVDVRAGEETVVTMTANKGSSVSGTVTDESGNPVEKAYVYVRAVKGRGMGTGSTAENGRYIVTGLAEGDYTVEAVKRGYKNERKIDISVGADTETTNIDLVLGEGLKISGRVFSESGTPAARVRIIARSNRSYSHAVTDDQGQYTLKGLTEERYNIKVYSGGHEIAAEKNDVPSGSTGIDFELAKAVSVKGTLSSDENLRYFSVFLYYSNPEENKSARVARQKTFTGGSGEFEIKSVAPGTYWITAHHYRYKRGPAREITVTEGGDVTGIRLELGEKAERPWPGRNWRPPGRNPGTR